MNLQPDNPFRSPELTSEVSDSPVPRKYPWSIIRAQLACVALALAQFGESYVNRYDVDGIHEMMLYGGVATLAAGAILAIPDWRTMTLPFLYFTVVTAYTFFLWFYRLSSPDLTFSFHSGWLQSLIGLTILFQVGSVSARRYYLRGNTNPFKSPKTLEQVSQGGMGARVPPTLVLFASFSFLATGVMHATACYVEATAGYAILAALSCVVGVTILVPARPCWFLGLLCGIGMAGNQFAANATTYVEVPWSIRVLGTPLLLGHVGSVVLLFLARAYYPPRWGRCGKPSE